MSFFFDDASTTNGRKKSKEIPINTAKLLQCTVCPLKKAGAYNPDMPAWGSPNPLVYFMGEAPGEMEDRENRPFIGPSGEVLAACIPDAFKDKYRLNNTVRSRPPANRTPTALEQACCRASIIKDIKQTQPNIIVALGTTALNWLFEDEKLDRSAEIAKWRGRFFPVNLDGYVCWGYCVYHPSYILRNRRTSKQGVEYKSEHDRLFEADMKRVFDNASQPKPNYVSPTTYMTGIMYSEGLKSNRELNKVLSWIDKANSLPMTAFDYETNDLRPYKPDSRILTLAIGTDQWCVAFPVAYKNAWTPQQKEILDQAISGYLTNGKPKIAHSTKFELEWSAFFYGQDILKQKDWQDTQGIAYILDERRGTHNLDILIRTYFGFWLKSVSNLDRTRMESYPLEKILPYNALDSKWTFALYKVLLQALKQDKKLVKVYNDLLDMMVMLTQIQLRGVVYNDEVTTELLTHHQTKLTEIEELIWSLPEANQYEQAFNAPFNIGSPTATIALYKYVLGREKDLITETGSLSTDEGQLSQLTDTLSISILKWRRHSKVISTYLEPMPKYVMPDGRIHTMYNPYETVTGRLCVAKGTMVEIVRDHSLHPDGIPVENVKAGDYAYTFDNNLNVVLRRVTWSGKTGTKKVMRIHWVGTGNKTKGYIDLTCNHPVRMIDGNYKRADQLDVGDRVLAITKTTIPNNHKITKIEWLDDLVDVYDLGVEDTHNFIGNGIALSNSSDSPNLQNFPSKTGKEPRGMIKAPPGHVLVCCDYGQIEARLIGVASQDPVFCKALWENYDVHMEWARKIAEAYPKVIHGSQNLDNKNAMKTLRSKVKNLWVFPAFYGASYRSIAAGLKIPESVAQELFEEFWDQFSGVRKWQRWLSDRYNELGYTESLFGRRRHAPLTHNAIINAPIQSSASDICVLSMVKLNQIGLTVVLNVHDEIGFYIPEDQLETQVDQIVREMTRPKLSWLNIPISVEVKIGYDWFNMEESLTVDSTEYYNVPKALFDFRDIYRK